MSRETAVNHELKEIRDELIPQIPELADLQEES